jgi:hypothetical protein
MGKRNGSGLKELIEQKLDEQGIYEYYYYKATGKQLQLRKAVRSPLRAVDRHPSFNVFKGKNGKLMFKDFAGDSGDVYAFVMSLHNNCSFTEALEIIAADFGISKNESFAISQLRKALSASALSSLASLENTKRTKAQWNIRPLEKNDYDFFAQFGIAYWILNYYNVIGITNFSIGKVSRIEHYNFPIYGFCYEDPEAIRFYMPYNNNGLKQVGNVGTNDIFGMNEMKKDIALIKQENNEFDTEKKIGILAAGQKDVMAIKSVLCSSSAKVDKIFPLALSSETASLSTSQYQNIMSCVDELYVLYDNDNAGRKYAKKLHDQYGIKIIDIADYSKEKDVSDHYKEWLNPFYQLKINLTEINFKEEKLCKKLLSLTE